MEASYEQENFICMSVGGFEVINLSTCKNKLSVEGPNFEGNDLKKPLPDNENQLSSTLNKDWSDTLLTSCGNDKANVLCEMNCSETVCTNNQCQADNTFQCLDCDLLFPTNVPFKRHRYKYPEGPSPCSCRFCHSSFSDEQSFHNHACTVDGMEMPSSHPDSDKLKENIFHDEKRANLMCKFCNKVFPRASSLYLHYHCHAGSNEVVCLQCGEFVQKDWFSYHLQNTHGTDDQNTCCYTCFHCFAQFLSQGKFQKHMVDRHNQQVYPCEFCGRHFNTVYSLSEHIESHPAGPFKCKKCSSTFSNRRLYSRHVIFHRSKTERSKRADKKYICEYCASLFPCRQALDRHLRQLHSDDAPEKCPYCSYSSRSETNLKRHVSLHTQEKKYVCEICAASFSAKNHLKEHHMYVHSDDRPHSCPSCPKTFKNKSALRRHSRVHSESRPYICGVCSQNYKRMSHLKRHMNNVHGISVKPQRPQRIITPVDHAEIARNEVPHVISIDIPANGQFLAIPTNGQDTPSISYLLGGFVNTGMVMPVKNAGSNGVGQITEPEMGNFTLPPCATLLPDSSPYYHPENRQFDSR